VRGRASSGEGTFRCSHACAFGHYHPVLIRRGLYRLRLWFGEDAIAPGAVEGDRIERVFAGRAQIGGRSVEEVRAEAMAAQSIKAMIKPADIAALAMFPRLRRGQVDQRPGAAD
jgi:hypothetical protein